MSYCARHITPQLDPNAPPSKDCGLCRVEEVMRSVMPRDPSYRYWSHGGWRFCWTTERMGDGKFAAFIYRPVGRGSRSGTARQMKLAKELHFARRSVAKARAYRWYQNAVRKGEKAAS